MTVIFESGLTSQPANWIELTTADVAYITFQNLGISPMFVQATTGGKPTSTLGSIEYPGGAKETDVPISSLFPGIPGADRLWAYATSPTTVFVSHAPSTNQTVTITPSMSYTNARIAHSRNWGSGGTAVASSTATGFFANAPLNTLTYEKWKPTSATGSWEYNHGSAFECDYCCIGGHTLGTAGSTIAVQYWNGSAWVAVTPSTAVPDDSAIFSIFAPITAQRWRVNISAGTSAPEIAVIKFGKALQMERPLYGGHSPIMLARQTVMKMNESETGEYLGMSKWRTYLQSSFAWQNLTAAWVRSNWPTLQRAIETEPFFIAWRPSSFGEVAYGRAMGVPIPSNSGTRDLMSVELQMRALSYD